MKVIAKSRVKHNGTVYEAGQEVRDLNEAQALALEAAGAVKVQAVKAIKPSAPKAPTKEDTPTENATHVANMRPKVTMKKTVLRGIGLSRGLDIPKESTHKEIFKVVKEDFEARGEIAVTNVEVDSNE